MTKEQSVVIVVRDPDYENTYRTFGAPVRTVDVDLGRSDLSNPEEYVEWAESMREEVASLKFADWHDAAAELENIIEEVAP